MPETTQYRILTQEEVDKIDFTKNFFELSFDFSTHFDGKQEVEVHHFKKFLATTKENFRGTIIGDLCNILYVIHSQSEEKIDTKIDTAVKLNVSTCGGCGCHPTKICYITGSTGGPQFCFPCN